MLPEKEESVYSHRSIDDGHEGEHLDVALTQWHHVLYKQHMNRVISMAPHSLQATHEYGNSGSDSMAPHSLQTTHKYGNKQPYPM